MNFTKLVPNIFYKDINNGLKIFVDCIEFEIGHSELDAYQPFCVLKKKQFKSQLISK